MRVHQISRDMGFPRSDDHSNAMGSTTAWTSVSSAGAALSKHEASIMKLAPLMSRTDNWWCHPKIQG